MALTASNNFTGPTWVSGPVLRLSNANALPGGIRASGGLSNLVLDGGILELAAELYPRHRNFLRAGAMDRQRWRVQRLRRLAGRQPGRSLAQVTWGSGSFVPNGSPLMLGSPSDDSTVVFENSINLS